MVPSDKIFLWVPGLVFAVALLVTLRKNPHFLITPGALVLATALFYGLFIPGPHPVAQASARGWLLGPFPSGGLYRPVAPPRLPWLKLAGHLKNIGQLTIIAWFERCLAAAECQPVGDFCQKGYQSQPGTAFGRMRKPGRRPGRKPGGVSDAGVDGPWLFAWERRAAWST